MYMYVSYIHKQQYENKEEKNVCLHRVRIHSMNIISDIPTPPVVQQQITESEISNMEENVTLDDCMFLGYIRKNKYQKRCM